MIQSTQQTDEGTEMVKNIVVAVSSDLSEAALSAGVARARETKANLTLLHVFDATPWWAIVGCEYGRSDALLEVAKDAHAIKQRCNEAIKRAGFDGPARTVVTPLNGLSVGRVIANAANELDADLIVVGAGHESSRFLLKERIRDTVARYTKCSILLAKRPLVAQKLLG